VRVTTEHWKAVFGTEGIIRDTDRGEHVNLRLLFPRALLWLAVAFGHGLASAAEPKPRLDLAGDPLPPDAIQG